MGIEKSSTWRIRGILQGIDDQAPRLSSILLCLFVLTLTLGPRIPIPLDLGRRVDARIHEIIVVLLAPLICTVLRLRPADLRSPWYPFMSLAFVAGTGSLILKSVSSEAPLLSFGYTFRFVMFFLTVIVIYALAMRAGRACTKWVLAAVFSTFILNASYVVLGGLRGTRASLELPGGEIMALYGPGLVGEVNPLSAGIFFIFVLAVLVTFPATRCVARSLIFIGIVLTGTCVYFIGNRAAMLMYGLGLAVYVVQQVRRKQFAETLLTILFAVVSAMFFIVFNTRGGTAVIGPNAVSEARGTQWIRAADLIRENPLFGWSLGTNEAHQAFLRLWGELGLLGMLFFVTFVMSLLLRSGKVVSSPLPFGYHSNDLPAASGTQSHLISWPRTLKLFLLLIILGGMITDSLTPVMSQDLLALLVGLAWMQISEGAASVNSLDQDPDQRYANATLPPAKHPPTVGTWANV